MTEKNKRKVWIELDGELVEIETDVLADHFEEDDDDYEDITMIIPVKRDED